MRNSIGLLLLLKSCDSHTPQVNDSDWLLFHRFSVVNFSTYETLSSMPSVPLHVVLRGLIYEILIVPWYDRLGNRGMEAWRDLACPVVFQFLTSGRFEIQVPA
jgi:hypothetical protein